MAVGRKPEDHRGQAVSRSAGAAQVVRPSGEERAGSGRTGSHAAGVASPPRPRARAGSNGAYSSGAKRLSHRPVLGTGGPRLLPEQLPRLQEDGQQWLVLPCLFPRASI